MAGNSWLSSTHVLWNFQKVPSRNCCVERDFHDACKNYGIFTPISLPVAAGVALFTVNAGCLILLWMIGIVYTGSVVRTLERRFQLRSTQVIHTYFVDKWNVPLTNSTISNLYQLSWVRKTGRKTCWWQPLCPRWWRAWLTHQEAADERPSGSYDSWSCIWVREFPSSDDVEKE